MLPQARSIPLRVLDAMCSLPGETYEVRPTTLRVLSRLEYCAGYVLSKGKVLAVVRETDCTRMLIICKLDQESESEPGNPILAVAGGLFEELSEPGSDSEKLLLVDRVRVLLPQLQLNVFGHAAAITSFALTQAIRSANSGKMESRQTLVIPGVQEYFPRGFELAHVTVC
ncbi:MAG: hypothetical protein WDZ79_01170 [Candidatus Paceibacterota bacterium]